MPKRYLTGGGKSPKNRYKSYNYTLKFAKNFKTLFENLKNLYKKAERFLTPRCEEELSRGAVLIEFAICMPILIILLFYINDLVRIKRYYAQTEFVAQQFVNIIQNISQKREDKKITRTDIQRAASLAFLSIYPGKTMYRIGTSGSRNELSYAPRLNIFYVKGLSGGKASCTWSLRSLGESSSNPIGWQFSDNNAGTKTTSIRANDNVTPSDIYPTLKTGDNDEKIIVEVNLFNARHTMKENNETDKQEILAKKAFNCRLVAPKPLAKDVSSTEGWYFNSVVIFTPKPGLFSETVPS